MLGRKRVDDVERETDIEKALNSYFAKFPLYVFMAWLFLYLSYKILGWSPRVFSGSGFFAIVAHLLNFTDYYLSWNTWYVRQTLVIMIVIDAFWIWGPF